ncbi:MAG: protein kinase [Myxococcota bacterium]
MLDAVLPAGQIIDRYVVEELLGGGGMAAVYRVRHRTLNTLHALKVLTTAAPQVRDRLVLEGRIQAGLRHPNLVAVTDVLDVDGAPALLMEFVDGPTLEAWIGQRGPLPVAEVEAIFRGILSGVGAAHARGLVHRDLKPANVLLDVSGSVPVPRVSDFGIAKVLADDDTPKGRTRTGMMMGTPQYMSPEQYDDAKGVDARADVFALGCILYEMLMGRAAFDYPSMFTTYSAIQAGRWARVETERADVPGAWRAAIAGCLEPDRDARIGSCAELAAVLGGTPKTRATAPTSEVTAVPASRPVRPVAPTIVERVQGAAVASAVDTRRGYPGTATIRTVDPKPETASAYARLLHTSGQHGGALAASPEAPPAAPEATDPYVHTTTSADFWASVARVLPPRVTTPSQVAEFINKAPRAKARAPNGRHWTGKDVTARWIGMPVAFGGMGPVSSPTSNASRDKSGGAAPTLAGVATLVGFLVCLGSGVSSLYGYPDAPVVPATAPSIMPARPKAPSPAAPAVEPAAPAPREKPPLTRPREKTRPAGQGSDPPIRVVPGPAPREDHPPTGGLTDNDEIIAMAKAVINASSPQLQGCYNERLKQVEGLKGAWEVSFTIAKDGATTSVHVSGVNGSDAELEACMARQVTAWQFQPIVKAQPIKKTYRFGGGSW